MVVPWLWVLAPLCGGTKYFTNFPARGRILVLGLVALSCPTGCALQDTNFSQWPGFDQYYAAHPPRSAPPSPEERRLLEHHRPRFFLPPGHAGLVSFYDDYIAQGKLYGADGRLLSEAVDGDLLNRYKHDPRVVFVHRSRGTAHARPVVFARIERDELELDGTRERLTFLQYHAVFRSSGLPAGFDGWRARMLGLVADLDDWHQLDHYTAATVVLDASGTPVALMLQQHNYQRTYLFDALHALPPDGRPWVNVAERSNELYPYSRHRVRHRAVRFMTPEEMRYMLGFAEQPSRVADDISEGSHEAEYELAFPAPDDAFYTFKGFLGERRRLPGRDGPPGADYNTLPQLKPLGLQLLVGFWREGDRGDRARFEASYAKTGDPLDFAHAQGAALAQALRTHSAPR